YPDECPNLNSGPELLPSPPAARLSVKAGERYFLRELTAVDTALELHTDYGDRRTPLSWARGQSRFRSLDWSGVTIGRDDWRPQTATTFQRETYYENAAWMTSRDDTLRLDVLDAEGTVRASADYNRRDFLAENSYSGRTRVSWTVYNLGRPLFPGDPEPHTDQGPASFASIVKVSFANSTNPFNAFTMPDISGEGVIRVTWSQMPNEPFLFPVTFQNEEAEPSCFKLGADGLATEEQVACDSGLTHAVKINPPQNGNFFQPGDTLDFVVSLRDGSGNGLHPRDLLPSYNDALFDASNGLLHFNSYMIGTYRDTSSSESGWKVAGPLQDFRLIEDTYVVPYFEFPGLEAHYYVPPGGITPGLADTRPPTRYTVRIPENAAPGTYAIYLKSHRAYLGERLNRLDPFFFQVGREAPSTYPNRVGNCQICHNGVNSLDNAFHGLSVDHVEGCKTCHQDQTVGQISDVVHRLHVSSPKYSGKKGDCTLCHLTRESALRPSIVACNGCHLQAHGSEYFDLQFGSTEVSPNGYGNCANACHVQEVPSEHFLPPN
ncbi:MAG TPA: hypothetical protein VEY30_03920, partial [Myxococcaceae bacterium]|nr:hypothetical protein [Myxococcaceae bacterium]